MMHLYVFQIFLAKYINMVLILVVMDDALVPGKLLKQLKKISVLILVVMDDALVLSFIQLCLHVLQCLNPCCNG